MYYPNAHKGVKKLFIAQVLVIVFALLAIVPSVITTVSKFEGLPEVLVNTVFPILIAVFLLLILFGLIVAFVLQLIGLHQGGKDSDYIRLGFFITIAIIVLTFGATIFKVVLPRFELAYSFIDAFTDILSTVVIVYVILGIAQLAASLNNNKLVSFCKIIMWLIIASAVISVVTTVISHFLVGSAFLTGLALGLGVFGALIEVLVAILYFFLLLRATIALRK